MFFHWLLKCNPVIKCVLLLAESNQVLLFDWKERNLLQTETIFESCSIHGITIGMEYFHMLM